MSRFSSELSSKRFYNRKDISTQSNPELAVSTAIKIRWNVDFENQQLSGSVEHSIRVMTTGAETVDFDSKKLTISSVTINGEPAVHSVHEAFNDIIGSKVSVTIPESLRNSGDEFAVDISYACDPNASAIQWLDAAATKGKRNPFMFTQSQAIHARSLLPCQDSPGVKTTYSAIVRCPQWCTVLMSALNTPSTTVSEEGFVSYHWNQPVPTAAYLIALAAGELSFQDISERVRIWAEPEIIESAAFEFSETEEFLAAAESLTCPYMWKRYDVLCLPPSFPYGGMENPCLTFATPTLLAGDRSLADVIAHEIAHSWTGNLVTNATWEHFWLNEGWTVWLERNIMAKVKGSRDHLLLSSQIGWEHLRDDVNRFGNDHRFTQLVWPLEEGEDPDDAFSGVPYEKGYNFLSHLESIVGSEAFGLFVKAYVVKFAFTTVTTGEFRDFFLEFFRDNTAVLTIDWELHCFSPGMPLNASDFSNSLSAAAHGLSTLWLQQLTTSSIGEVNPEIEASLSTFSSWSSQQKCVFLESLLLHADSVGSLPEDLLMRLDAAYGLTSSNNAEIKFRWQKLCLKSNVDWILSNVIDFITSQGRMKFVRPLYRSLAATEEGKKLAVKTFLANNKIYHPIARKMVALDLEVILEHPENCVCRQSYCPVCA